jgi:hypothetical protein
VFIHESVAKNVFAATVNLTHTWDWPLDADTRTMIDEVRRLAAADDPPRQRVILAVEPIYIPVAIYYAQRTAAPLVGVVVLPAAGWDFVRRSEPCGRRGNRSSDFIRCRAAS